MSVDLSGLFIDQVIIHEVRKQPRSVTKLSPVYSEIECTLDDDLRKFFKDRIIATLSGTKSYNVKFAPGTSSPIPGLFTEWVGGTANFIDISKRAADHLNQIQDGRNPGGLLTVLSTRLNGRTALGIMKLEKEEGARLEQATVNGRNTFDVRHIRDLILSEKTRLFKVVLILENGLRDLGIDGILHDNQLIPTSQREVADFFLKSYLGCDHIGDPREKTKQFFYKSQEFFNTSIDDPILRAKAELHLISYLSRPAGDINPDLFARDFMDESVRQDYIDFLHRSNLDTGTFPGDIELINSKLKQMIVEFDNGVSISASQEKFTDTVTLTDAGSGLTRAEVVGKMGNVRS